MTISCNILYVFFDLSDANYVRFESFKSILRSLFVVDECVNVTRSTEAGMCRDYKFLLEDVKADEEGGIENRTVEVVVEVIMMQSLNR